MRKKQAIDAENQAMDELARIQRELETVNLLIIHHRQHPKVVARLADIRARLLIDKSDALARRRAAGEYI